MKYLKVISFLLSAALLSCTACESGPPSSVSGISLPTPDSSSTATPAPPEILPPEQLLESGAYEEVFGINFNDIDSVLVTSGRSGKTAELTDPQQVEEVLSLLEGANLLKYHNIDFVQSTYDERKAAGDDAPNEILLKISRDSGVSTLWAGILNCHTVTLQLCSNGNPVTDTFMLGADCMNVWRGDEIVFYKSSKNVPEETIDAMNAKYDIDVPESGTLEEILGLDFSRIDKISITDSNPIRSTEITDSAIIQEYLNRYQSILFAQDPETPDGNSLGGVGVVTVLYQDGQKVANFGFSNQRLAVLRDDHCDYIFYFTKDDLSFEDILDTIENWKYY